MKGIILFLALLFPLAVIAQSAGITGDVLDEKGEGLGYATVALLYPADSTLVFFGITNTRGHFDIRNAKQGDYLMQVAYIGHKTFYRKIKLPLEHGTDFGAIIMKPNPINLSEVQVITDRIPLLIKKDTIEYDAAAFKTKPDAVAEDLLRKLPGVEVDRSGNIKAVGEDVKNVLVDGKEFFGNDPKVATKNIPADAINKVQVYDKKSDESLFTGINDGSHDKTVNLLLKDDKKKAVFGDVKAGGGTGDHYQGSAKIYRFTGLNQFAALGMVNNINQFGFSFSDYLSFSGGIGAMSGGNVKIGITTDNSFPVNFGQPVNGNVTSGAAGLNFSHEFRKNNRFYISYLGNASGKDLSQHVYSQNFIPGTTFIQQQTSSTYNENWVHRLNFGWKYRIDSGQNLVFSGNANLSNGFGSGISSTKSLRNDSLINDLQGTTSGRSEQLSGNLDGTYLNKLLRDRTTLKISGNAAYSYDLTKDQWQNLTHYYFPDNSIDSRQYQKDKSDKLNGEGAITFIQNLGKLVYMEPLATAGYEVEHLNREQGIPAETNEIIDSLSPAFSSQYQDLRPGIRIRRNTNKTNFSVTAQAELGKMTNQLKDQPGFNKNVSYFIPQLSWEYEYAKGRRISFDYSSLVNTPTASQLLPVANTINPLVLTLGNRTLGPEYIHDVNISWMLFDQFSFTSLFTSADLKYTHNKINWSETIDNSLAQRLTLVNVPDDYTASGFVDFSTPLKKLGLTFHSSLMENWNRGIIYVNNVENMNTDLVSRIMISFDNRKKTKWDVNAGASVSLTNGSNSIQESTGNSYFDLGYFGEIRYTPNDRWSFDVSADVTDYNARTFNNVVSIPLIGAEATFYFLKNNRGMLSLSSFDLLNKNTGVERVSELNYLRETRSNIIARYVMLTFKYRINKFKEQGGPDIKINHGH